MPTIAACESERAIATDVLEGAGEVNALDVIFCVGLLPVHFAAERAAILGPAVAAAAVSWIHPFHILAQHRAIPCNSGHASLKKKILSKMNVGR